MLRASLIYIRSPRSARATSETLCQEEGWPGKSVVSPTLPVKLEQVHREACLRISQTPLSPGGFQVQLQMLWNGREEIFICVVLVCSSFLSRRPVGVPQLLSRICFRKNLEVKASDRLSILLNCTTAHRRAVSTPETHSCLTQHEAAARF